MIKGVKPYVLRLVRHGATVVSLIQNILYGLGISWLMPSILNNDPVGTEPLLVISCTLRAF